MLAKPLLAALAVGAAALTALPAAAAVDPETAFVFNSFSFLVNGLVVMFMAAGFAMLESLNQKIMKACNGLRSFV